MIPPIVKAIRAIAVEFFTRMYIPIVIVAAIIFLALFTLCGWLISLSGWWWILFVVLFLWFVIAVAVSFFAGMMLRSLAPVQTKAQAVLRKELVDKMQQLAEVSATPKFILLFRVVRDGLKPSKKGYITSLTDDTVAIKKLFSEFQASFRD